MTDPSDTQTGGQPPAVADQTEAPPLLAAYRHDIHKLRGRAHDTAGTEYAGVRVNESVPAGADQDAARLSRPEGAPERTVDNHTTPFRLSLRTGETVVTDSTGVDAFSEAVRALVTIEDPERAHRAWLDADAPAAFNEAIQYPYTALKYHVLLTAALLSNYRAGAGFDDLWLVVDPPSAGVTPHRTILHTDRVSLRLTHTPGDRPAAPLGPTPARSFADTWSRLSAHPPGIDPDDRRVWRLLNAQLRRLRAWSTALQYLEDMLAAVDASGSQQSPRGGVHEV